MTAMAAIVSGDYGEVLESGAVRFTRLLPGNIEKVWAYLTQSDLRATWLAAGPMELRLGGRVELEFWNSQLAEPAEPTPPDYARYDGSRLIGQITRLEPPHLLAFTWGEAASGCNPGETASEVTFELTPEADRVRLMLTHRRLTRDSMLSVAPGWHSHLDMLARHATSQPRGGFWQHYNSLKAHYDRVLA